MNSEIKKGTYCAEYGRFKSKLSSIPNDGETTASDVYDDLLGTAFAGTHEDYHKDVFIQVQRFQKGVQAVNKKHNGKMTLQSNDLQNLSIPYYVRGNGIRVASVLECWQDPEGKILVIQLEVNKTHRKTRRSSRTETT